MPNLDGQVALVTGGGRGIGSAICFRLAIMGAKVAVNFSKSSAQAEEVVTQIKNQGGTACAFGFDVSNEQAVDSGMKQITETFGGLDILVNNAGIAVDGLILRMKKEDWQKTIDINLNSIFYTSKAAARLMLKARRGRIINISSVIGEMGNAGQSAYAASKSAMFGFSKSLAKELGSRGITVNVVAPGYIKTDMTSTMTEDYASELMKQIPLGRIGEAEDVAALVAFLASPNAGYITGEVIAVNGGLHM